MKTIFLLILSFSLFSCGTKQKFEQKISDKNCEEALELLPEKQSNYKLISKTQQATGTLLSYAATGTAYTVQVLWDVTATVGGIIILCAPSIAAVASTESGTSQMQFYCIGGDIKKIQAPHLGKKTLKNTESWRCPNVDAVSNSIRKVAKCYSDRGGQENFKKALSSLKSVENSGQFYSCLSKNERESFLSDLELAKTAIVINSY